MPDFIPGLVLCGHYYREAVRPILDAGFPGLRHSAALLGPGSEVLGFDTEMSTDHDWGPRLLLFLEEEDHARLQAPLREALSHRLPRLFRGYPTGTLPNDDGTRRFDAAADGPIHHAVQIVTLSGFLQSTLHYDRNATPGALDWLTFTQQELRTMTAGAVYHDEVGLQAVRDRFAWYPHDIWLYLLASVWTRIGQEEHLTGRAGFVGDELGASLIASRLIRDLMRLCFLLEREYAPYPKWFGTAFGRLACAAAIAPLLNRVQRAATWQEREEPLVAAYEKVAALQNARGLTGPLPEQAGTFHNRPFRVIHLGSGFAGALTAQIRDPEVRKIADSRLIGSIEQFSDSTDLLCAHDRRQALRGLYEAR